jgi:hypothetical protein
MAAGRFSVEAVFKAVDKVTAPVSRMQNRIGKLTRSMTRGLKRADRQVSKITASLRGVAGAALRFGGAAVAAGLAATALAIDRVAGAADELAKRTRRLKFPIEEFQQWQFVAEQSGLSTESFDKAIEKFTKSVGEARAGTGTLVTILKKANPELLKQITSANNSSEAFDIYIKALRGTENQMDKTALATAAFGRTGAKFLNITEQSEAAIKALRIEQVQNGVITAKQAKAAEDYNDAVNSLKKSLGGLLQNVILPMLPAITKTLRGWRELIVANKEIVRSRVVAFFKSIKPAIVDALEALKKFNAENDILGKIRDLVLGVVEAFKFLVKHGETILKVTAVLVGLLVVLKTVTTAMALINLVMAINPFGLIIIGVAALIAGLVFLVANWDKVKDALKGSMRFWKDVFIKGIDLAKAAITSIGEAIKKVVKSGPFGLFMKAVSLGFKGIKAVGAALGIGGGTDETQQPQRDRQTVSPEERMARRIETSSSISKTELSIKDGTGRAELSGSPGPGTSFTLARSGAF